MKPNFAERIEFGSLEWVAAARDYLTEAVATAGSRMDGMTFSICESFTGAPAHLKLPDDTAAWNARFENGRVTVNSGIDDTTLFRIRGSYHAVLPIARAYYPDAESRIRAQRENLKRVGGTAIQMSGTAPEGVVGEILNGLHNAMARRTVDNPDLAQRIAAQGLARNAQDLDESGYTILSGAFSNKFADELRATILARIAENRHPQAPAAMLLERGRIFEEAALHPWLMTLAEKVCGKGFLLAQLLGQRKGTGPSVLGLHSDYNLMREPFPQHSQACTAIWALEDFTLEAGPTMVIPGSHKLKRHPRKGENVESLKPLEMPKGSIALWDGATWHAQGDRSLAGERVTLHSTYSRLTLRTYDSYLNIAPEILGRNPPELATLCGLDDLFEKNTYAGPDFQRLRRSETLFRT